MQSFYSIETYAYRRRKGLVGEKGEIKCNNVMKQYKEPLMMLQKKTLKKHNPDWTQIPDHSYIILKLEVLENFLI